MIIRTGLRNETLIGLGSLTDPVAMGWVILKVI